MSDRDSIETDQIWAIVPAAGIGQRMRANIPKQYLQINAKPILQLTLERLLSVPQIEGVVVALQSDDQYWNGISLQSSKPVLRANGGKERCHSVINALQLLQQQKTFDIDRDWVMVHDAVRPCVSVSDIQKLITEAMVEESGGLLAAPVRDTMKRQDQNQNVDMTVDRDGLWHALTPQLFPCKSLLEALQEADKQGLSVTDESSAMEIAGMSPKLVHGSDKNIKITRPPDLQLAEYYLSIEEEFE